MNNNYYYYNHDDNKLNYKKISYKQWINENLNNLNYLNNIFIDLCYNYNINFSNKKYEKILNEFNYNMYLSSIE